MNGVDMALVPPGCFKLGLSPADIAAFSQQPNVPDFSATEPQTPICFAKAFWIDKNLVTNQQFIQFKGQAAQASHGTGDQLPRANITWFEAQKFCALRGGRLPTEAEWEYAARGPDDLAYPWGNSFVPANAVYPGNSNGQPANVGSKPDGKSWVGALDMAGNVQEWTNTIARAYPYKADDGRESSSDTASNRVLRGGAWNNSGYLLRSAYRFYVNPFGSYVYIGFRCVQS